MATSIRGLVLIIVGVLLFPAAVNATSAETAGATTGCRGTASVTRNIAGSDVTVALTYSAPATLHYGYDAKITYSAAVDKGYQVTYVEFGVDARGSSVVNSTRNSASSGYVIVNFHPCDMFTNALYSSTNFTFKVGVANATGSSVFTMGPSAGVSLFPVTLTFTDIPQIIHTPPGAAASGKLRIEADVSDNGYLGFYSLTQSVETVEIYYLRDSETKWNRATMYIVEGTEKTATEFGEWGGLQSARYFSEIQFGTNNTVLYYYIRAVDCANTIGTSPAGATGFLASRAAGADATADEKAAANKAPSVTAQKFYIDHTPVRTMQVNLTQTDYADVTCSGSTPTVELFCKGVKDASFTSIKMTSTDPATAETRKYSGTLPKQATPGNLSYYIKASAGGTYLTSPQGAPASVYNVVVYGEFRVVSTYPRNGDLNLPPNLSDTTRPAISITFSDDLDTTYVSEKTIKVYHINSTSLGRIYLKGLVTYDTKTYTARFLPDAPLPRGEEFTVCLSDTIQTRGHVMLGRETTFSFFTMPDVKLTIKPIQVLQDFDLVESKPAVVRVFAEWSNSDVVSLNASVVLKVDGREVAQLARKVYKPLFRMERKDGIARGELSANFFDLKFVNTVGTHTFEATVTPLVQHTAVKEVFTGNASAKVRSLKVEAMGRYWNYETRIIPLGVGDFEKFRLAGKTEDVAPYTGPWLDYMARLFPVAVSSPTYESAIRPVSYFSDAYGLIGPEAYVNSLLFVLHKDALMDYYERYVGIVPAGWLHAKVGAGGLSDPNWWNAVLVEKGAPASIMSHELLHTYEPVETHIESINGIMGYDVRAHKVKSYVEAPLLLDSVMSATPGPSELAWISPTHYRFLMNTFTSSGGRSDIPGKSVLISGTIGSTNQLFPAYILDLPPDTSGIVPGNATVQILDGAGTVLASYSISGATLGTGLEAFAFRAALPENYASVVLKNGPLEVARMKKSANAPVVTVSGPSGIVSGIVNVSWSGSDADGDNLTYTLMFSQDGTGWSTILSDVTCTTYSLNSDGLCGTGGYFRILASDGLNTGLATSPEFLLVGRSPTVSITGPSGASELFYDDTPITFTASAYDMDDGELGDTSVSWKSSLSVYLGTGNGITVGLIAGTHTITVTAMDLDGNRATASVKLTVNSATGGTTTTPPAEDYYIILSATSATSKDGKSELGWFGNYPAGTTVKVYSTLDGSQWDLVEKYTGAVSATLTGLNTRKKTTYYFAVEAVAPDGTVLAASDVVSVTTQTKAPPPPPSGPCLILPGIVTVAIAPAMVWMFGPSRKITRRTRPDSASRKSGPMG